MRILLYNSTDSISNVLTNEGFVVDKTDDVLKDCELYQYDIIILHFQFPDEKDLSLLKMLRRTQNIPIIILSLRKNMLVNFFSAGCDDFIVFPFYKEEFVARIYAILRRAEGRKDDIVFVKDMKINLTTKEIRINEELLHLTKTEYNIIEYLAKSKRIASRELIIENIYNIDEPQAKIIDTFICHIRKRIRQISSKEYIKTVRGRGWQINW